MSTASPIDKTAFEPPYAQLARLLRERIVEGEYRSGDRLPSEPELCEAYQVSRMTVRRAVTLLVRQGVATTERGRGTYVKAPEVGEATFDLRDLRRYLADPAIKVRVLETSIVTASARVAGKLAVKPNARVITIKRLLLKGDDPVFYHSAYLVFDPARPLVEAELNVTSLQGLLSGSGGSDLKYGKLRLHASTLRESEATYLREQAGASAWVLEHLFYDFDNRPESWGRFVGRADRLTLSATVGLVGAGEDEGEAL